MYIDITKEWADKNSIGSFSFKNKVEINGRLFVVGENGVTQEHDEREIEVAKILANKYGFIVELLPDITGNEEQQHIQMPDYFLNSISYEYKRIYGKGKNTFIHSAINGKNQSDNFIFDISYNEANRDELIDKARFLYTNKNTRFVKTVVIMCKDEIIKVFSKKEEDPHPDNKM